MLTFDAQKSCVGVRQLKKIMWVSICVQATFFSRVHMCISQNGTGKYTVRPPGGARESVANRLALHLVMVV